MSSQLYAIAAGSNIALNSLVNIESITPNGDTYHFFPLKAIGFYSPGNSNVRGDGLLAFNGFPSVIWYFDVVTRLQLSYARSTWCSGGWSGLVTIYTTTGDTTYARYNANLLISLYDTMDGKFYAIKGMQMAMTRLVAL